MSRPVRRAALGALAASLLSLAAGCADGQELATDVYDEPWPPPTGTSSSSDPKPTKTAPAQPPASSKKPRPPAADNELGLPHDVIVRLGRAADVFGYGLGPGTVLDYEQATDFAYAVSTVCDGWRSGDLTFQDSVDEDVTSGAPASDARAFNRFLESDFCPAYYRAGN